MTGAGTLPGPVEAVEVDGLLDRLKRQGPPRETFATAPDRPRLEYPTNLEGDDPAGGGLDE